MSVPQPPATDAAMLGEIALDQGAFTLAHLRASPDCVKLLNAQGRITFMSENGMCAMQIDSPAEITGKTWWELWPAEARDSLRAAVDRAFAGQIATHRGSCPTAKGEPREWDVRVSPLVNGDGSITQVLAVSRDVTQAA